MIENTRMKKVDHQVKEFIKKVSDEDIKLLNQRLTQRVGSDLSEALILIQNKYSDLHKVLSSANSGTETYDIIDVIQKYVIETNKRLADRTTLLDRRY